MFSRKGAIYYDYMLVKGGAEYVTEKLHEHFHNAQLIVSGMSNFSASVKSSDRITCLYNKQYRGFIGNVQAMLGFSMLNRKQENDYSWNLYSGVYSPLAAHSDSKNIYYCHTPPRFLYDLKDFYCDEYFGLGGAIVSTLEKYYKPKYLHSLSLMEKIFVNSKNVQDRLLKYTGYQSEVLYPPCNLEGTKDSPYTKGGYYLSTGRLETLKRVDLIIEAFRNMPDKKLIVMSGGGDSNRLKRLAHNCHNIVFTGWVGNTERMELIKNALATIYIPKDEDFGMAPIESMAFGKPVIGVAEGGLLETIKDRETGILIEATEPKAIVQELIVSVQWLNHLKAKELHPYCKARASGFSQEKFFQRLEMALGPSSL